MDIDAATAKEVLDLVIVRLTPSAGWATGRVVDGSRILILHTDPLSPVVFAQVFNLAEWWPEFVPNSPELMSDVIAQELFEPSGVGRLEDTSLADGLIASPETLRWIGPLSG